jgi:molybdate transport system substrate-binding protein
LSSFIAAAPIYGQSPLLIGAASDLAPSESALAEGIASQARLPVRFSLGSSGQLASQIRNGAPYDVYLSANVQFVRDLASENKLDTATVRVYAKGRLGLWSRDGKVRDAATLTGLRHIAIANPAHAPYGAAARNLLERAGLWAKLRDRIVYGENVRQAFQFAESGNADATLVAWTLVHNRGGHLMPQSAHSPIEQGAGVVSASTRPAEGRKFLDWLLQPKAQSILKGCGLFPPKN